MRNYKEYGALRGHELAPEGNYWVFNEICDSFRFKPKGIFHIKFGIMHVTKVDVFCREAYQLEVGNYCLNCVRKLHAHDSNSANSTYRKDIIKIGHSVDEDSCGKRKYDYVGKIIVSDSTDDFNGYYYGKNGPSMALADVLRAYDIIGSKSFLTIKEMNLKIKVEEMIAKGTDDGKELLKLHAIVHSMGIIDESKFLAKNLRYGRYLGYEYDRIVSYFAPKEK